MRITEVVKKIRMTVSAVGLAAAIVMLIQVQTVQAVTTDTLSDLVNPTGNYNSLTIGNDTFSDFGYVASEADASELATEATGLTVTASIMGGVYYLNWNGGLTVDNLTGASTLLGDLDLTYTVTANSGSISMIDQQYTPNALPSGGQIIIGETVYSPTLQEIVGNSTLTLNPTDLSDPPAEPGDNLNFSPEQQLDVTKDIQIAALAGQLVGLSDVEQSFHPTVVPEPATSGCLLLGFGVLACARRFRK